MKPKFAKYGPTATRAGCPKAKRCIVCGMCKNWKQTSAVCRECYPKWPYHCICKQYGAEEKVQAINEKLDTPLYSADYNPNNVNVVEDPTKKYEHLGKINPQEIDIN